MFLLVKRAHVFCFFIAATLKRVVSQPLALISHNQVMTKATRKEAHALFTLHVTEVLIMFADKLLLGLHELGLRPEGIKLAEELWRRSRARA